MPASPERYPVRLTQPQRKVVAEVAPELAERLKLDEKPQRTIHFTLAELKAKMGHDVVSVALDGADQSATGAALEGLPGLERVVAEPDALALYVEDGAGSIAEIVRRLERAEIAIGAISVSRPSLDDVFLHATGRRLEGQDASGQQDEEEESR